jgi:hypothetical protein
VSQSVNHSTRQVSINQRRSTSRRYLSVSTVIQKFLNTAHTDLLKQYLEAVSQHPAVMRPAYAAVLISLYVQQRDRDSLQRFLHESIDPVGGHYKYNVSEAINSCLYGVPLLSVSLSSFRCVIT